MQMDGNLANVNLSDIFISVFTRKAKTASQTAQQIAQF